MVKPAGGIATGQSPNYATVEWLADHPEVLEEHVGKWVAVADQRVVAHGDSVVVVMHEAKQQGYDDPLLVPVMPYPFVGG